MFRHIVLLAIFAVAASSAMATTNKNHGWPSMDFAKLKSLIVKPHPKDPVTSCLKCYSDIMAAVESCGGELAPEEILICVGAALGSASDCLLCVCEIVAVIAGIPTESCNPALLHHIK